MRRAIVLMGICFAMRIAAAQSAPPPGYGITGVLRSSVDQVPIHAGTVTLQLIVRGQGGVPASSAPAVVQVDEHGHFSIPLHAPGAWSVIGAARGFATEAYQQHGEYSTAVVVSKEHPSVELQFELSPASTIAGVIRDEAGEPLREAQVALLQGDTRSAYRSERTDDRGMYRFGSLPVGRYWLKVEAQPWYFVASHRGSATPMATLDPLDVSYPQLWFPGVGDPARAHPLDLHAGETKTADLQMTPIPSIHLRIAPSGRPDARPETRAPIVTIVRRTDAGTSPIAVSLQKNDEGDLDLGGLAPGEYEIDVAGPRENGLSRTVTANEDRILTLTPTPTQGDSRVEAILEERRHLRTVGAVDGTGSLAIVEGVVRSEGKPVAGALILLVPAMLGQPGANEPVRCEQSGTDGGFRMTDVLPSRYILVAIENGWHVNWHDTMTLSRYLIKGRPLELSAGSVLTNLLEAQKP